MGRAVRVLAVALRRRPARSVQPAEPIGVKFLQSSPGLNGTRVADYVYRRSPTGPCALDRSYW